MTRPHPQRDNPTMDELRRRTEPQFRISCSRLIALASAIAISGQALIPLVHEVTAHGHFEPALDHSHDGPDGAVVCSTDSLPSESEVEADCPVCLALSTIRNFVALRSSPAHTTLPSVSAVDLITLRDLWVCSTIDLNLAAPRAPPA